jgi:hypothetical protein
MMDVKGGSCEWFKIYITIDEGKERLRIHNRFGWNFFNYLYTPRRNPKLDKWVTFVEKFKTLFENVQELIINKLHGGMEVWCIQLRTLIIDTTQLTKYWRWLPIIMCLLMLIPI